MEIFHKERLDGVHPFVKQRFLDACKEIEAVNPNYDILVVYGLRSLVEQAKLYRQGRTKAEIESKKFKYIQSGHKDFADAIDKAGPQMETKKVTNAGPGESNHNWGYAIDYVRQVDGKEMWNDMKFYRDCTKVFKKYGFNCGIEWTSFPDTPHIELTEKLNWTDFMAGRFPSFTNGTHLG